MKNTTLRVIIILVSLLFLNIEAAHAGLIHKLRIYISHELSPVQMYYICAVTLIIGFLAYVVFSPILIGNQKWAWHNYFTFNPGRNSYQSKRHMVKKISVILSHKENEMLQS